MTQQGQPGIEMSLTKRMLEPHRFQQIQHVLRMAIVFSARGKTGRQEDFQIIFLFGGQLFDSFDDGILWEVYAAAVSTRGSLCWTIA